MYWAEIGCLHVTCSIYYENLTQLECNMANMDTSSPVLPTSLEEEKLLDSVEGIIITIIITSVRKTLLLPARFRIR